MAREKTQNQKKQGSYKEVQPRPQMEEKKGLHPTKKKFEGRSARALALLVGLKKTNGAGRRRRENRSSRQGKNRGELGAVRGGSRTKNRWGVHRFTTGKKEKRARPKGISRELGGDAKQEEFPGERKKRESPKKEKTKKNEKNEKED